MPPTAAADVGTAADWNAAPTNGSPGVDVPKLSGNELLGNTDFAAKTYLPWTTSFTPPGDGKAFLKDGQFCVTVTNKGKDPWDAQARHRDMVIQKGHVYSIKYTAHATKPVQVKTKVGMSGPPHKEYWADTVDLTTRPQAFVGVFSMEEDDDATAEFAFHFGGAMAGETQAPYTVCFDDIHLDDPKFVKTKKTDDAPVPNVLVNQVGYVPALAKVATLESTSTSPLPWTLRKRVARSSRRGSPDGGRRRASGDDVVTDFSSFDTPGTGYVLSAANSSSYPFDISADPVKKLRYDSLAFFYHQRSGIAMRCRTGGSTTRPAGHLRGRSGRRRPTRATRRPVPAVAAATAWTCAAAGTTRATRASTWSTAASPRGSCRTPTSGPSTSRAPTRRRWPTARWRSRSAPTAPRTSSTRPAGRSSSCSACRCPPAQPDAGMVHHKIHDENWTGMPDACPRRTASAGSCRPVSTAATLNLAAVAAQASRLWKTLDPTFSAKGLAAAQTA